MKTIIQKHKHIITCKDCMTVFGYTVEDLEFKCLVIDEKFQTKAFTFCVGCPECANNVIVAESFLPKFWRKTAKQKALQDNGYSPEYDSDLGIENWNISTP